MNSERELLLENQLCFLLYTASRLMGQLYTPFLAPLGLTYPQYLVLLLLWERDDREVGEITERLVMDTGTVSPLLKRMEREGLVVRRRDSSDERRVRISLTARGGDLKERAREIPGGVFCRSGLAPEEYISLKGTLENFLPKLKKGRTGQPVLPDSDRAAGASDFQ